ncbi:MAG TPA: hypothetical protein VN081_06950 [Dongiaceae bacterium]|nr:hypothetical protein [Dongiaceae bacterium]
MPRNGSGTYTLPAGNPVVTGTTISSTVQNNTMSDVASALTQSLTKNGETVPTANLPMGGFKFTNLGGGSALGDSANFGQTINQPAAVTLASAATVNIGAALSSNITISGTTTITAFDNVADGITRNVTFSGALALTHNATSLILPGTANITTAAGDCATFLSLGSGNWRCTKYVSAAGIFGGLTCVSGLTGVQNSTTPLTKFDLSADSVTLRNSAGGVITRFSTGTITCDLGLTGPAANGRDQSAAFTASSWLHLYFIWDGSTLATLASTTAPASFAGSTLPTGYTHWCYATTIRWNGSSNIVPCYARGSRIAYQAQQTALSGGAATSVTSVDLSSQTPPNALGTMICALTFATSTGTYTGFIYLASGTPLFLVVAYNGQYSYRSETIPNVSQQVYYKTDNVAGTVSIFVTGYVVANGDA